MFSVLNPLQFLDYVQLFLDSVVRLLFWHLHVMTQHIYVMARILLDHSN